MVTPIWAQTVWCSFTDAEKLAGGGLGAFLTLLNPLAEFGECDEAARVGIDLVKGCLRAWVGAGCCSRIGGGVECSGERV